MKENVLAKANAMKGLNELSLKGEIVIFGSTYMANFPFYELVNKCKLENAVYNRSIANMTIDEAQELLKDLVIELKPSKVFLALGEEDENDPRAAEKYGRLVRKLRAELPDAKLYLICLTGDGEYVKKFNENILSLCDKKRVDYIKFTTPELPAMAQIKARFKQMSCFFHNKPLDMLEAFAIAAL